MQRNDWFRQAQDRKKWRLTVRDSVPVLKMSNRRRGMIDAWIPGNRLPAEDDEEVRTLWVDVDEQGLPAVPHQSTA